MATTVAPKNTINATQSNLEQLLHVTVFQKLIDEDFSLQPVLRRTFFILWRAYFICTQYQLLKLTFFLNPWKCNGLMICSWTPGEGYDDMLLTELQSKACLLLDLVLHTTRRGSTSKPVKHLGKEKQKKVETEHVCLVFICRLLSNLHCQVWPVQCPCVRLEY